MIFTSNISIFMHAWGFYCNLFRSHGVITIWLCHVRVYEYKHDTVYYCTFDYDMTCSVYVDCCEAN